MEMDTTPDGSSASAESPAAPVGSSTSMALARNAENEEQLLQQPFPATLNVGNQQFASGSEIISRAYY